MKIFLLVLLFCFNSFAAKEIVVLVPGFFNSIAPEYFSKTIVKSFTSYGLKVFIAKDLNPVGSIAENGAELEKLLEKIETSEGHKVDFSIVAHSAGGLYSLWVSDRGNINIKKLITISTPFQGVEFVQTWIEKSFLFSALTDLAYLHGLQELTPDGVDRFLKTVKPNPNMQMFSFGGYQMQGLDVTDARNISVPLLVTSHYISGRSDGVVSLSSALGYPHAKKSNHFLNLEHWEQVKEPSAFVILGIRNTHFIQQEQERFYKRLAQQIVDK